jgi:hypothetical protein
VDLTDVSVDFAVKFVQGQKTPWPGASVSKPTLRPAQASYGVVFGEVSGFFFRAGV